MYDNRLRIAFDFKYPDEAALIVYESFSSGMMFGADASIKIVKTYVGESAIELYSKLSGKTIETIKKEAGYTPCDEENADEVSR